MAESDPMKDEVPVRIVVARRDRKFLEEILTMARDGIREELGEGEGELREPRRLRREEAAYARLLTAIEEQQVVADPELCVVLAELAKVVDESNEYSRVVAEHRAMRGLLASLERRGACGSRRSGPRAAIRCAGSRPTSPH
jgi:hypothetical protein